MNAKDTVIHIEWTGPYRFEGKPDDPGAVESLTEGSDFGVYQIYGGHPVYGASSLLYIGLAAEQKFGRRVPQETHWLDNRDAGRVEVYVGRLAGSRTPAPLVWDRQIRLAERLLIFAHSPPMNTQKSLAKLEEDLRNVHVLNWGRHRDLLPEVSGSRWSNRYNEIPNFHVFAEKESR